jgi:hypothetical protein
MWSTWDLLTAASTSGVAGSEGEDDPDFSWDFSELRDPSAMQDFMFACDHCLSGYSDDGHNLDDEGYDPSRECFHIDQGITTKTTTSACQEMTMPLCLCLALRSHGS